MGHNGHYGHEAAGATENLDIVMNANAISSHAEGHMDHGNGSHMHMDGMKMYFHFGLGDTLLLKSWVLNSSSQVVVACIAFFLVALLYEGLKSYRETLLRRYIRQKTYQVSVISPSNGCPENCVANDRGSPVVPEAVVTCKMLSLAHLYQSFLHTLQVTVSYALMLGFMSFNVWICLAIALGAGHGYFLFCWRRLTVIDSLDHCN